MEENAFTQQQNIFTYFWMNTQWMNQVLLHKVAIGGSSRDHYYQYVGITGEAARLLRREQTCGCKPCLQLKSQECELTHANVNVKQAQLQDQLYWYVNHQQHDIHEMTGTLYQSFA